MDRNGSTFRNLQNQVWYLTNYLENEAQLVQLGIKVVGVKEALPIPDGQYEYGDSYMIGSGAPYTLYVWTRANESNPNPYWFNVGPFPLPGPKGDKGDGLETVNEMSLVEDTLTYDTTDGIRVSYQALTDIGTEHKDVRFPLALSIPLIPGFGIKMDQTESGQNVEIQVDQSNLDTRYYRQTPEELYAVPVTNNNNRQQNIRVNYNNQMLTGSYIPFVSAQNESHIGVPWLESPFCFRLAGYGGEKVYAPQIYYMLTREGYTISGSGSSGTLTNTEYRSIIENKHKFIWYDGKIYTLQTPIPSSDGTVEYAHIDTVQAGGGNYNSKITIFSITGSTRAYQVIETLVDPTVTYRHNISLQGIKVSSVADTVNMQFTIYNNSPAEIGTVQELKKYLDGGGIVGITFNEIAEGVKSYPVSIATNSYDGSVNITYGALFINITMSEWEAVCPAPNDEIIAM